MDNVINFNTYRKRAIIKRIFGPWQRRFGETYDLKTRLKDLSGQTLLRLAKPSDNSAVPYYELIMGVLDFGHAKEFFSLDDHRKMTVVDIHLFLADHVRFEMMHRLIWLKSHSCLQYPIVTMVGQYDKLKPLCLTSTPELIQSHPRYGDYSQLIPREKQIFIRKMLTDALDAFQSLAPPCS